LLRPAIWLVQFAFGRSMSCRVTHGLVRCSIRPVQLPCTLHRASITLTVDTTAALPVWTLNTRSCAGECIPQKRVPHDSKHLLCMRFLMMQVFIVVSP
jgi:hypothetical protein